MDHPAYQSNDSTVVPVRSYDRMRAPGAAAGVVYQAGAYMSRLAFLAEAPAGEESDVARVLEVPVPPPLVGPSGRLLGEILREAGLARTGEPPPDWSPEYDQVGLRQLLWERSHHWVGNVWDFRLADDNFGSLFARAPEAREGVFADAPWYARGYGWLRPEYHEALDLLAERLHVFAPDAVVTLGAAATWALTGEAAIRECRGTRMAATRVVPGVPVYPTLHPAHVLQDFRMRDTVVADIRRAAAGAVPQARHLWLEPDLVDMGRWWEKHGSKADLLAIDIETAKGQVECIGFAPRYHRSLQPCIAICVPFVDWRSPDRGYWPHAGAECRAWGMVEEWLASSVPKVFQNGLYDVAWLWGRMGLSVRNYRHDTRLMAHTLDPEMPKSLAYLGSVHTVPPGPWKLARHEEKRDA